jgi:hypothetical protein
MKLQMEAQHLRVRIDEAELARLLSGDVIHARTRFADAFAVGVELRLAAEEAANLAGQADTWKISLPEVAVREHASRLPTRDGLRFVLPGGSVEDELTLLFDVDVRDSVRRRRSS